MSNNFLLTGITFISKESRGSLESSAEKKKPTGGEKKQKRSGAEVQKFTSALTGKAWEYERTGSQSWKEGPAMHMPPS